MARKRKPRLSKLATLMLASAKGEAHDREVPVDAVLQSFEEDMDVTRDLIDSHPKFDVRKYSDGDIYDAIYTARQYLRDDNPHPQRFLQWFTDIRPWGLARHATTLGADDTITLLFAPWADSPNKPRWGLPKSHKGIQYLQREIPKRAAMEGVYLVPVGVRTDFEQADFGVGERGDQPVARGRIFLTFKQVDSPTQSLHQTQRRKRRRERNPGTTAGDLVRQLKF